MRVVLGPVYEGGTRARGPHFVDSHLKDTVGYLKHLQGPNIFNRS